MGQSYICIDCGRTVATVSRGRCPACLPAARKEQNAKYGDRTGRMTAARRQHQALKNHPQFRRVRKQALARDGYRCRACGIAEDLTVHHEVKARTAPDLAFSLDNLITLCRACHGRVEKFAA